MFSTQTFSARESERDDALHAFVYALIAKASDGCRTHSWLEASLIKRFITLGKTCTRSVIIRRLQSQGDQQIDLDEAASIALATSSAVIPGDSILCSL